MHALGAVEKGSKLGKSLKAYSEAIGRPNSSVDIELRAARVAVAVSARVETARLVESHRHLAEIHAAPTWLWPALRMLLA
jgi:hypothetical protein